VIQKGGLQALALDGTWSQALGSFETSIAGAVGSILAHQLVTAHTEAGALGGQLLGAVGSIVGVSIGQALGISLNIILPGIGSLLGTIVGTLLGDAFAPDPKHPMAESTIDPSTYSYGGHIYYVGDGGNSATSNAMADAASSVVNAYLTSVNGVALAYSEQLHITYQSANPGIRFRSERGDRRKLLRISFRARSGRRILRRFPARPKQVTSLQAKCA
jgi:uncharacterized membrane protein YeaQ/YmgE (transglycosylase-associated protein family)